MEEEVTLQGVFKDRKNRDANAARPRLYFGKGFNSISGRQLGTEKFQKESGEVRIKGG